MLYFVTLPWGWDRWEPGILGKLAFPGKAGVVYLDSSPCPHTLSGLLATSESTLVLLFPGKRKWTDMLALPNASVVLSSPWLLGRGGEGRRGLPRQDASRSGALQGQSTTSYSVGSSLRGVPSNGDRASPQLGLKDWLEPGAKNLPEKNRQSVRGTAAL